MITRFFRKWEWELVIIAVILILLQVWMDISIPDYMGEITDHIVLGEKDIVVEKGIMMLICAFMSLILSFGAGFVLANLSASVGRNMRIQQFDHVQAFSVEDINRFSAASLITRSTNDVSQIQNFIARGLQATIKCPIITVWALGKIFNSSIEWSLLVVVGILVLMAVMFLTIHFASKNFRKVQWLTDSVNRSVRENLDGIRVIRAYGAEEFQEAKFTRSNNDLLANNLEANKVMAFGMPISQSMMNFVCLGIYWVGASLILAITDQSAQFMKYSDMIVFSSYATMVLGAVMQFFGILRILPRALVGYRRIVEVVETESSICDGSVIEGAEHGTVKFDNVCFSYPGSGRNVLDKVSFTVEKGSTFAIVGPTGSGKSTLISLITRFYDADSGSVSVDGVDVKDYTQKALHAKLGYVPQTSIIFSGSVVENINYGDGSENRSSEDVRRAMRVAQAEEFIEKMSEKENSHVSQHGKNLSGGQKQRISIARAVCKDPEIYLFDDSFSALDYKTDRQLRDALRKETKGSTVIIVAQRIGTIMDADQILVLDEGRVVGLGTHDELMGSCDIYHDLAVSQLGGDTQ